MICECFELGGDAVVFLEEFRVIVRGDVLSVVFLQLSRMMGEAVVA